MIYSVCAVIVTYFPEKCILKDQLDALIHQVESVLIIDNGSDHGAVTWLSELCSREDKLSLTLLDRNYGIAKAQNEGVVWAKAQGADFVLLMDQDSRPAPDMVNLLLSGYERLILSGKKVSAIGPRFEDVSSGRVSQHVRFGSLSVSRGGCNSGEDETSVDFLIASGSLIPISVLNVVGLMDEGLFIDHVDTEWILRAKSMGYASFGSCNAKLYHSLGEQRVRFWFGRWRDIPLHKPFRYYYVFRNSLVLYRRSYMGWHWKRVDLVRLMQFFIFMSVFSDNRIAKMKMMYKGLVAGIRGEQGRMPD